VGTAPPTPDPTGFYAPLDPGPGPRGEVLGTEPLTVRPDAVGWRVRYRTLDAAGRPVTASMALAAPAGITPTPRPVVVWVHGAVGVAPGCGPSRRGLEAWYTGDLIRAGIVVAAPDLTGLGMEGRAHPYLHGTTAGHSVLDAARAAAELTAAGAGNVLALIGHSAGGHAVLWANQLACGEDGAGLDLRLVVAMSAISDLAAAMAHDATTPGMAACAVQVAATWPEVEPVDADAVLTPAARDRIGVLQRERLSGLHRRFGGDPARWVVAEGFRTPAWSAALERQSAGRAPGAAPVLLVHGDADRDAPITWAHDLAARLDHVELRTYPGVDHMGIRDAARADVVGRVLAAVDRA
jgi:pimeloyl-ACP methyl ester carboxylesterase